MNFRYYYGIIGRKFDFRAFGRNFDFFGNLRISQKMGNFGLIINKQIPQSK